MTTTSDVIFLSFYQTISTAKNNDNGKMRLQNGQFKNQLPSEPKATSDLRGPQRPYLTGVGVKPRSNRPRSYSLNKSSGDSALFGISELARKSRGGTLNARAAPGEIGGTLRARDGRTEPTKEWKRRALVLKRLTMLRYVRMKSTFRVENASDNDFEMRSIGE